MATYITRFSCPYGFQAVFTDPTTNYLVAVQDTLGQYHYVVTASNATTATGVPGNSGTYYAVVSGTSPTSVGAPAVGVEQSPTTQAGPWSAISVTQQTLIAPNSQNIMTIYVYTSSTSTTATSYQVAISPYGPNNVAMNDSVGDFSGRTILAQFDWSGSTDPYPLRNPVSNMISLPFTAAALEGFTGAWIDTSVSSAPAKWGGVRNTVSGASFRWLPNASNFISFGYGITLGGIAQSRSFSTTNSVPDNVLLTRYDVRANAQSTPVTTSLPVQLPYAYQFAAVGGSAAGSGTGSGGGGSSSSNAVVVTQINGRSARDLSGNIVDVIITGVTFSPNSSAILTESVSSSGTGLSTSTSSGTGSGSGTATSTGFGFNTNTSTATNTPTGGSSGGANLNPLWITLGVVGGALLIGGLVYAYRRHKAAASSSSSS